jgi:phage shock protein E
MMSRRQRKQQRQTNNNLKWFALLGVALVLIAGAVILLGGDGDADAAVINERISPSEYQSDFASKEHVLVDVRTPEEYNQGMIEDAININVEELASRVDELPKDEPIVLYCRSGNRSAQAAQILEDAGFTEVYDLGGIIDWTAQGNTLVMP